MPGQDSSSDDEDMPALVCSPSDDSDSGDELPRRPRGVTTARRNQPQVIADTESEEGASEDEDSDGPPALQMGRDSSDDEDIPELVHAMSSGGEDSSDASDSDAEHPRPRPARRAAAAARERRPRVRSNAAGGGSRGAGAAGGGGGASGPGAGQREGRQHFLFSMPGLGDLMDGAGLGEMEVDEGMFEPLFPHLVASTPGIGVAFQMPMMFGHGQMDPIIQALQESFRMASREPPKPSPDALETVVHIQVREGEAIECPISAETVEVGEWAGRMPCGHWFGSEGLLKWLEQKNTCPVCRYEIATVDEEYNIEKGLKLEACQAAAEAANKNPDDAYCKRIAQGVEDAQLDEMAEAACSEVMEMQNEGGGEAKRGGSGEGLLGKRGAVNISPSERGSPQMTQQQRPFWGGSWGEGWSDTLCEKVLEEVLEGEGVLASSAPTRRLNPDATAFVPSC